MTIEIDIHQVKWLDLPSFPDERGILTQIEGIKDIPFEIKRIFYMHHVKTNRGGHAHRDTDQVAIAINGNLKMELSDGRNKKIYELSDCTKGLYFPRLIFTKLFDFSKDAVCMILASTHYDRSKSIRSYEEYVDLLMKEYKVTL